MSQGSAPFRLRQVALSAYAPTVVNAIGHGAVTPMLALRATDLGAGVSTAALVVALLGVGQLLASLPAGALVARVGERRSMVAAGLVDVAAMSAAALSASVTALAAAVVVSGMTWTVFLLARQQFMIEAVPVTHRARAMSALGGSHRIGLFIGPLLGAVVVSRTGVHGVFWLGAAASLTAAAIAWGMPDPGAGSRSAQAARGHLSVREVLRRHRGVLVGLGSVVVVISASRSLRTVLLPLWAESIGMTPEQTSLVFGAAAAVDMVLFHPAGWLMDHRGRAVVAVPVVGAVAVGSLVLPLTGDVGGVALVAVLMAVGNGLGAGIVMTLGADAAPVEGRAQFLGAWRLAGDVGASGGPVLLSALLAWVPLAVGCLVVGVLGLAGAGWTGLRTARVDAARRGASR